MAVTTVVDDDTALVDNLNSSRRFSWTAAFAGALVAVAVTLFLLTLGSGVGLSLVTARHATQHDTVTFLALGAIYFLAAQAFGFAAGGHIAGRLMAPQIETSREEDFRAAAHGLVAWAIAVAATAALVALSAIVVGGAATGGAVNGALSSSAPAARGSSSQPAATAYWVDMLFRPSTSATQASLAWRQYAQADNGTATDGSSGGPDNDNATNGDTGGPSDATPAPRASTGAPGTSHRSTAPSGTVLSPTTPANETMAEMPSGAPGANRNVADDKAEAGRILTVTAANGGKLSADDRAELTRLVQQDAALSPDAASHRVADVESRMHQDEVKTAEAARKAAAYASLWTAIALLFGAVLAAFAAISARAIEDREAAVVAGGRVSEVRF